MAPKSKKKNKNKIKGMKSDSKSTTPQRDYPPKNVQGIECSPDDKLVFVELKKINSKSNLSTPLELSKLLPIRPSSPTTSFPSSLSPTRSNASSRRSSLSPIRSPLSSTRRSQGLFEEENVSPLDSIDNDESGWTQISRNGSRQRNKKNPCHFLSNHLSPSTTPPNEEVEYIQDQRLATSSNQVQTILPSSNLTNLVGIELQMKSYKSSPILHRPLEKGILGRVH